VSSHDTATWPAVRLGELVKLTSGQSPSGFKFGSTGKPYFKVDQLGKATKYLGRASTPYLSGAIPDVPAGSVLIAKRGGAIALNRVRLLTEPGFMDTNVMALSSTGGIEPEFLYYWLSYRGLWDIADVTSVPQINNKHINPLEIALPSLSEQRTIVTVLRDADNLITTLERQISKKQAIKQGMLQELLTGRTRLPGFGAPWNSIALGTIGSFLKGRSVKRDDVRSSGVPCIRYGELYTDFVNYTAVTRSFVRDEIAATALPIQSGDLLFAGSGETREEIGMCVAYVGDAPAVAGGDIVILRGKDFNPVFLATLANAPIVANQKARAGQGDAVVHISSRALASINVEIPSFAEQDAIARVLVDADREIHALKSSLTKTRAIKQGMMQELLTGLTRLPVEDGAA
jgi:type I restriction enzyme S subunit